MTRNRAQGDISAAYLTATDSFLKQLIGFTLPPRPGTVIADLGSDRYTVHTDDTTDNVVTATALNGFVYAVDDIVYILTAANAPDTGIILGGKGSSEGTLAHDLLTGLSGDDHTIYLLLAGRSGGQTARGGTGAGDDLTLESTSHATKGDVIIQPSGGNVGIGVSGPADTVSINRNVADANRALFVHNDHASSTGTVFQVRQDGTGDIFVCVDGGVTVPFVVKDGGNVGIGTSTPDYELEVEGSSTPTIAINDTAGNGPVLQLLENGVEKWHVHYSATNNRFTIVESGVAERFVIEDGGQVGIGTTSPQGIQHTWDGTAGSLVDSQTGVAGSAVTIIPNGTGDVANRLEYRFVATHSAGGVTSGRGGLNNAASVNLWTTGGATLTLAVAANGAVTLQRTAGTGTFNIAFEFLWI